jgi:hypothetical protein
MPIVDPQRNIQILEAKHWMLRRIRSDRRHHGLESPHAIRSSPTTHGVSGRTHLHGPHPPDLRRDH